MTQMEDYKKKYEQALERCKKEFNFNNLAYSHEEIKQRLERIFPELKESEDERIRKSLIEHINGITSWNYFLGISKEQMIAWLEKQCEQKPTDKVEPKFKVGDWITNGKSTFQIVKIEGGCYVVDDGEMFWFEINNQDYYHLWTIQDAKDGDALVTHLSPEGDWIGIYKESVDILGFKTYCFLNGVGEFVINPNRCRNHGTHGLHPATKEQRDFLFQKMKEAGYEWDTEKKELKKIEQKPAWSEEDENMLNFLIDVLLGTPLARFIPIRREIIITWLKSLKERMKGE